MLKWVMASAKFDRWYCPTLHFCLDDVKNYVIEASLLDGKVKSHFITMISQLKLFPNYLEDITVE
jgi:hypothetical protein